MGWTGYYDRPRDPKAEIDRLLTWENEGGKRRVLKGSFVGSTYYAAVEHTQPDGSVIVWAAVFLTSSKREGGTEWGYKDMDETVGPCESDCPACILDLLTDYPGLNDWAREWRQRCRDNIEKKKAWTKDRPKPGQVIEFAQPIRFSDGKELARFEVSWIERRGRRSMALRSCDNGGLYRVSRMRDRKFSVVAHG